MSVRMRVNRSHTGHRRSHHALKEPRLSTCSKCDAKHLRHRMCPECGSYRGREVVNVAEQKAKKLQKREEKLRAMGEEVSKDTREVTEKEKNTQGPEEKDKKEAKKK